MLFTQGNKFNKTKWYIKSWISIFLNNISKEALADYLIYSKLPINPNKISKNKIVEIIINDRAIQAHNDIDMLAVDVNKLNVYNK